MSLEERDQLEKQASMTSMTTVYLSKTEIRNQGRKLVERIGKDLKKLEMLGYDAFVYGVFDGNVELEYTEAIAPCFTPNFITYLHAALTAAKPPPILSHTQKKEVSGMESSAMVAATHTKTINEKNSKIIQQPQPPRPETDENNPMIENPPSPIQNNVQQQPNLVNECTQKPATSIQAKHPSMPTEFWLKINNYELYPTDKHVVLSSVQWLNDNIINAAQSLLKENAGSIRGFQNTQLCKKNKFNPIEEDTTFIQILHTQSSHWITISNIHCSKNEVVVYDSRYKSLSLLVKIMICVLMKQFHLNSLKFMVANVQQQTDSNMCGVFAIAFAAELAYGFDPHSSSFHVATMRKHLCECLEKKMIVPFPKENGKRDAKNKYIRVIEENLFCKCREVNDYKRGMIQCHTCSMWFHLDCMGLDCEKQLPSIWRCEKCMLC